MFDTISRALHGTHGSGAPFSGAHNLTDTAGFLFPLCVDNQNALGLRLLTGHLTQKVASAVGVWPTLNK